MSTSNVLAQLHLQDGEIRANRSGTVTEFDLTNNTLHYNLPLSISIHNPNKFVGIYYDYVEANASYHDVELSSQTFGTFFQPHNNDLPDGPYQAKNPQVYRRQGSLKQLATKTARKSVLAINGMTKPHKFRSEPEALQLVSCLVPSNHDALHRLNHTPPQLALAPKITVRTIRQLEPNRHEELHVDGKSPEGVLPVESGSLVGGEWHHALALEEGTDEGGVFGVLEEGLQCLGGESNILVKSERIDMVVVDAEPAVGVADGDVDGEVVVERVVGEREAREGGLGGVEFEDVGANDEPEEEHDNGGDDDQGREYLADEAQDAVEDAPAAAAQAPAPPAPAGRAAVVFPRRRRRNGRAVFKSGHVDVRGGEPNALVERVGVNSVVVDLEFLVRVSCCDVEYEVVAKGGVGGVVELRELGVGNVESEGAGCDDDDDV
ncbi:unnamed protein product [Sphenostylis stenocarpa]|uniref:Late embryogenesis abundant protein LEA-2 subgroup domain-containing protein n=1 Tax=Sphenostylis stenocarpa TaxID=92480 RepID=A0AA86SR26_9FABA|nr:unnamed protein product [Sphenostylis stenocarpa]